MADSATAVERVDDSAVTIGAFLDATGGTWGWAFASLGIVALAEVLVAARE